MFGTRRTNTTGSHDRQLVLLAPGDGPISPVFRNQMEDPRRHAGFLSGLQRLRGSVYLADGAIRSEQTTMDGRHTLDIDDYSWHLLILDRQGQVTGCARYLAHPHYVSFDHLGVAQTPLADSPLWGRWIRQAVESHIDSANREGLGYVEVGGWALAEELRGTCAALHLALASYALAELLGSCLSIGTVTHRHASAAILRRIGGQMLTYGEVETPVYWDPRYECEMEILTFDSRKPNPKYAALLEELKSELRMSPVVAPHAAPIHAAGNPAATVRPAFAVAS